MTLLCIPKVTPPTPVGWCFAARQRPLLALRQASMRPHPESLLLAAARSVCLGHECVTRLWRGDATSTGTRAAWMISLAGSLPLGKACSRSSVEFRRLNRHVRDRDIAALTADPFRYIE
jgi:hypothetical protein